MIESSMALGEYLRKISVDQDGDFLCEGVRLVGRLVSGSVEPANVGCWVWRYPKGRIFAPALRSPGSGWPSVERPRTHIPPSDSDDSSQQL